MDWLYQISTVCFLASYLIALVLEISRIYFKAPYRRLLILSISLAGWFAHTVYLLLQTELEIGWTGLWLGSWAGWCLAGGWVLMAIYIWVFFRHPQTVIGIFFLPVVIGLTVVGSSLVTQEEFSSDQAKTIWNMVHSASLLLGTVIVALGFVFGVVYLVHARRLKLKKPHSQLFRLPSLEWLQKACEQTLIISTGAFAIGFISGIAIHLISTESSGATSAWTDPVVWTSLVLFLWLTVAVVFSMVYQPARQGRKVAYLVVASFLFLVLELGLVWWVGHGQSADPSSAQAIGLLTSSSKEMF